MRIGIPVLAVLALCLLGASQASAKSCSTFAVIASFDEAASTVEVKYEKGKSSKFFPKPEGTPRDTSKIPGKCTRKVTKLTSFKVKATGGRMTMTQVRSNFQGKMLNDADDAAWLPAKLNELVEAKTLVVIVIRPGMGKDAELSVTTIYVPITEEEKAEIKRLESQGEDL